MCKSVKGFQHKYGLSALLLDIIKDFKIHSWTGEIHRSGLPDNKCRVSNAPGVVRMSAFYLSEMLLNILKHYINHENDTVIEFSTQYAFR